ncbi:heme exporter protein CcmB [Glaciecola sp. XM2]|jgi:heme exporter protein B|uniref:heme exporter protein CcmB n=1 Tax=Glaciecola sp. XM2 TaxID=1914931 RepID=UPI001BDE8617|nr:heme exporter protein CcmB [Glaciecola sp. XM2]MBT1450680.1 heme exporter protein CcmB [Glaciecola sp. XM2]
MSMVWSFCKRDIALAYRQRAELMQPLMFFMMVITLFPLAIGPSPEILQRVSGGVIWVAAILSLLLGMERMFRDDFNDGTLEQYTLSPTPLYMIVLTKVLTHWFIHILPLLLLSPLLALFLNMNMPMYKALIATLVLGTPVISLIGAIGVALTVGLQRSGVLVALLLIPLFIPLLIFATSAIDSASLQLPYSFQLGMMAALLLFALAAAPAAISYSLRVSQH